MNEVEPTGQDNLEQMEMVLLYIDLHQIHSEQVTP